MKHIAIFASGEGSNALHIMEHFRKGPARVSLVICNNPQAGVLAKARSRGVPSLLVDKEILYNSTQVIDRLLKEKTELIVCAGFLWKVPDNILQAFLGKVINIHPALLPKFGGKGMYGLNVHKAVLAAGEKESGITVHFVNEQYDEGRVILQKKCTVSFTDTPESLARKVQALEHEWYPKAIEQLLTSFT